MREKKDLDEITDWNYHFVMEESEIEFHLNEDICNNLDNLFDLQPNVNYHTFDNPSNYVRYGKWNVETLNMHFDRYDINLNYYINDGKEYYALEIKRYYKFYDPYYGEKTASFYNESKICQDKDGNLSWIYGSEDIKAIYVNGEPITIEKES